MGKKKLNYELLLIESCIGDYKKQQKLTKDFKGCNFITKEGQLALDVMRRAVDEFNDLNYDNYMSYATTMTDNEEKNNEYVIALADLSLNMIGTEKFDEYLEIVKNSIKQEKLKSILKNVNIDVNEGNIDAAIRKLNIEAIKDEFNKGKEKTREEKLVNFMLDIDKNYSPGAENGVYTGIKLFDNAFGKLKRGELFVLGGASGCVDAETEYFNGECWKPISEYKEGENVLQFNTDTNEATLVKPLRYIKKECNEMYYFKTKYGIDQMLSPDHRVIYYKDNSKGECGESKEMLAKDIYDEYNKKSFRGRIKTDFIYNGKGIDLTDIEIKLMCAVICDGYFRKDCPNSLTCRINLKKDRKKKELEQILNEYGIEYSAKEKPNGYTIYNFHAPRREKEFLPYWYNCSKHQLQLICDNVLKWDGSVDAIGRKNFSTTIKNTADFVQFAFASCGYRATLLVDDRRGRTYKALGKEYTRRTVEYDVSITKRNMCTLCGVKGIEVTKSKDGYCYCFTVQSGCLVLRRNGRIFITGNCGKSLICNNMFSKWILEGKNVIYLSLEMGFNPVFSRTASIIQGTNPKFYRGSFENRDMIIEQTSMNETFVSRMNLLNNWDIISIADLDNCKATIDNVLEKCLLVKKERNWSQIDCIILDYLQFLDRANYSDTEYEKINDAVNKIKAFVLKEDLPFILITSLNANGEIKGSTSILYTSDFSATIDADLRNKNIKHLKIIKSRYGTCGGCKVSYDDCLRVIEQETE